jgi:hypothetical protein
MLPKKTPANSHPPYLVSDIDMGQGGALRFVNPSILLHAKHVPQADLRPGWALYWVDLLFDFYRVRSNS